MGDQPAFCAAYAGFQDYVVSFVRDAARRLNSAGFLIPISAILTAAYFLCLVQVAEHDDGAYFGGDTWDYQAMAVNFARGHGIAHNGGVEDFPVYRFNEGRSELRASFEEGDQYNFYRTPGYFLFVGALYKAFGVSPLFVKRVQLLLLCIVAGGLPWVGHAFWRIRGFAGGLLAGVIVLLTSYGLSNVIMAESLMVFFAFLILVTLVAYDANGTLARAGILGFVQGLALLVKGTFFFVPLLTLLYIRKRGGDRAVVFACSAVCVILPWSFYASMKSKSPVVLSTMPRTLLLDSNNLRAARDGGWHPEWRKDKTNPHHHWYNQDERQDAPAVLRVLNFYQQHPSLLAPALGRKLVAGFSNLPFLWLIAAVFIVESYDVLIRRMTSSHERIMIFRAVMSLLLIYLAFYLSGKLQYTFLLDGNVFGKGTSLFGSLTKSVPRIVVAVAVVLPVLWNRGRGTSLSIPAGLRILLLNFVLVTLIFYGSTRFLIVIDFVVVLIAVTYGLDYLVRTGVGRRKADHKGYGIGVV